MLEVLYSIKICASLIDLSKCFDCVPHDFLLHKLAKYGILDNEHRWFNSYLSHRKQSIAFNNILLSQESVNIGVPQDTVLGPILYLIYMNDLPDMLPPNSCVMYADDITLYCSSDNI